MGGSGKWLKSLIQSKKSQSTNDQNKRKWKLWRSSSEGFGSGVKRGHVAASEASDFSYANDDQLFTAAVAAVIRAPPKDFLLIKKEWAAIRIQAAFRAFLSRRALRALKAVVRIQAIFRGRKVRKQAAITLRCMQALVRVQARVRAQSVRTEEQEPDDEHPNQNDPVKQAEEGWCANPGTFEEVKAKQKMRQEGAVKRERAIAYALSQQKFRSNASPSLRPNKSLPSIKRNKVDDKSLEWTWIDRWMPAKAWDKEETQTTSSGIMSPPFSTRFKDGYSSYSGDFDTVKVKKNNVTTRVSAKPPRIGQVVTHLSSDPSSESMYDESSASTSSSSLSPSTRPNHIPMESNVGSRKPSYMNLTQSTKAKQRSWKYPSHNLEDLQFFNKLALSSADARSSAGSDPIQSGRLDWVRNGQKMTR